MKAYSDHHTRRRRILRGGVVVLLLLLLFGGAFWALYTWENADAPAESDSGYTRATMQRGDATYRLREDVESLLIIGLDKYEGEIGESSDGYRNNQQADFLLLLLFNRKEKVCHVIHLNRDTITKVPVLGITGEVAGENREQLALAHTYGSGDKDSCKNTVRAVENLLYQTPIDHYVSITMDALPVLNDAVGGVTLTVQDDFSAIDPSLVKGQTVTLYGDQALTYVQSRYAVGDQSNLNRMARQRQYLNALKTKAIDKIQSDGGFSLSTALKISEYMVSDCTVNELSKKADLMAEYDFGDIIVPEGEAVEGESFMEYYVDDEALQALVIDLFYESNE